MRKKSPRISVKSPEKAESSTEEFAATISGYAHSESTQAVSRFLGLLGGVQSELRTARNQVQAAESVAANLANTITAAVREEQSARNEAQPAPSNIMAAMRLADYFCMTEGDVYQTIAIPWEVIGKEIEISQSDAGAKKIWQDLWSKTLNVNDLFREIYWSTQISGQAFPLEVWDKNSPQKIVMLPSTSVWVGRPLFDQHALQLSLPSDTQQKKWLDGLQAQKDLMYSSFVTDQNVQSVPASRVAISPDRLTPVFGHKRAYERYAYPHLARAARNILHREILEEYRRGTIESYMSQLWAFIVGSDALPPRREHMRAVQSKVNSAAQNRSDALVLAHPVRIESHAPKTLDAILGNDFWDRLTQAIFRDLGFSMFIVSGERPGVGGGGGGNDRDLDIQMALERWKYFRLQFLLWVRAVSQRFALAQKDKSLADMQPDLIFGSIGVEQNNAIKARIMPLLQSGQLSSTTALRDAGYRYDVELENKEKEKPDKPMFYPSPTYVESATNLKGDTNTTAYTPEGRPPDAVNPEKIVE